MTRTYSLALAVAVVALITSAGFAFADTGRDRGIVARSSGSASVILPIFPPNVSSTSSSGMGGANGGTSSGNGGNGGNASPGGLVRSGNVVSNATALNVINVNIVRISTR